MSKFGIVLLPVIFGTRGTSGVLAAAEDPGILRGWVTKVRNYGIHSE